MAKIIDFPAIYQTVANQCRPVEAPWKQYLHKLGINQETIDHVNLRMAGKDYPQVVEAVCEKFDEEDLIEADVIFDPLFEDDDVIKGTFHVYHQAGLEFLIIPYTRNGRTVFLRARPLCNRKKLAELKVASSLGTGASPCPFNMDATEQDQTVYLVRGEIPAMIGMAHGLRVLGISRWERFKQIWVHWFKGVRAIRMIVERNDSDTQKGLPRVANMFIKAGLPKPKPIKLPKGADFNQLFDALARKEAQQNAPVVMPNPLADEDEDEEATKETQLSPPPANMTRREGDEGSGGETPAPDDDEPTGG